MGGNPHNRCYFNLARNGSEIVGASTLSYIDDAATLFIGFVRATAGMGGQGLTMLIDRDGAAFARDAAKDAGKKLLTFSAEVEKPEEFSGKARAVAERRVEKFLGHGWGILGAGTSFAYAQPAEDGVLWPLNLMVKSLDGRKTMKPEGAATLVRSIFASIYNHLKKEVYDAALGKILQSIPDEPLRIVR
jgi:hypothetical protein